MIVLGKTTKGYWPAAAAGKIPGIGDQIVGYPSHPFAFKMNTDYIVGLARTYEQKYRVKFEGMEKGPVTDLKERLIQFKTNMDVAMSVLDCNGLGDWLADRLVQLGDMVKDEFPLRIDVKTDPFLDERLRVANLPEDAQTLSVTNPGGAKKDVKVALFRKAGETAGARRAISEIVKWLNYVTGNRMQPLGPLRSGGEPQRYTTQGRDSGGGQRLHGHRARQPERVRRSRQIRGRVGRQRHVRRIHAAHVSAGEGLEPAEPGQPVPHGRPAHSVCALGARDSRGRAHPLRHFFPAGLEALPARPGHQPELLGLQRRGGRVLRCRRDRGPR
jgi:hypothetical protein